MQAGPNLSAARTPSQGAMGWAGFQRRSPVGGAPNGIPLKTATPFALPGTPETSPSDVRTGALSRRPASAAIASPAAGSPKRAAMTATTPRDRISHLADSFVFADRV